jgi:oxygen-independent coproporphyrinogen-3 oxidase
LQRDYLKGEPVETVYLGGGTPSLLDISELNQIFSKIQALHTVLPGAEITLEANPDDLTTEKLRDLRQYTPVNRLSIGVQSFADIDLKWMNRAHQAAESRACIEKALATGFQDLTIDLIYGAPTTTDAQWAENLRLTFEYGIPHLSCYCLTVEEGTALHHFVEKGKTAPVEEEKAIRQFDYLLETTAAQGYEQYEISNFAREGRYAQHNSNYWRGKSYLGIGPSAHSFDGVSRQWNIANNALYIKHLAEGKMPFEREVLTESQRFNEYVMTALRTSWGVETARLAVFSPAMQAHFEQSVQSFLTAGTVERLPNGYRLTRSGKFLADGIAAALFV